MALVVFFSIQMDSRRKKKCTLEEQKTKLWQRTNVQTVEWQ